MYNIGSTDRIGGVMVSVLASSAVDSVFYHLSNQTTTMKLVCATSSLTTQHQAVGANPDLFGIMIMCPGGETCLPRDYCFSELAP